ncbi:hypothetical protein KP509_20G056300 [Ceratopteris richardii]|uniref:Uncharacterized protein n=1 Tax=Ceratopteris richardii TaxID=49495 RepID=A0A8T2SHP7_CERRI|nr:hypothetical protein KP509_20G056300 [Ceratopteris richardii]
MVKGLGYDLGVRISSLIGGLQAWPMIWGASYSGSLVTLIEPIQSRTTKPCIYDLLLRAISSNRYAFTFADLKCDFAYVLPSEHSDNFSNPLFNKEVYEEVLFPML